MMGNNDAAIIVFGVILMFFLVIISIVIAVNVPGSDYERCIGKCTTTNSNGYQVTDYGCLDNCKVLSKEYCGG